MSEHPLEDYVKAPLRAWQSLQSGKPLSHAMLTCTVEEQGSNYKINYQFWKASEILKQNGVT